MERSLNSRIEKQSIYEIYRACRLCGAGAGYKMPIIQNVIDLDDQEVQLKQKIQDCVQIEVHQDDKMPPLICELCVDKVNDFYEFLEMCKQTNIRTRMRLGLPPQSLRKGAPDAGDCILGLTEPVYINSDEDEPLVKQRRPAPKSKAKKEPEARIKIEKCPPKIEPRTTRHKSKRDQTPPRVTRHSISSKDSGDVSLIRTQDTKKSLKSTKVPLKSILKKEDKSKSEDTSLLTPRLKRPRDRDVKIEVPSKTVKIAVKSSSAPRSRRPPSPPPPPAPLPPRGRARSKLPHSPTPSRSTTPPAAPSSPLGFVCPICDATIKNIQGYATHMKSHTVGYTSKRLSCNACALWFTCSEQAQAHHRRHRARAQPYACRRCTAEFNHIASYDEHFDRNQCIPYEVVPDVKCERCWHEFPTRPLLDRHKCPGEDARPGGKCEKCKKNYALLRNLRRHEQTCTARKKGDLIVDPELLRRLKPIQVRVARCDPLLVNIKQEHYDVSTVSSNFGLDRNCTYPYISSVSSLNIKMEPDDFISMVTIKQEIKEEFCTEENFVHWDSTSESDTDTEMTSIVLNPYCKRRNIDSLSTLTLKTIFSHKFLGKVPKKRRKLKIESGFDCTTNDIDDSVRRNISDIINNLSDLNDSCVSDTFKGVDNEMTDCSNDSFDLLKGVSMVDVIGSSRLTVGDTSNPIGVIGDVSTNNTVASDVPKVCDDSANGSGVSSKDFDDNDNSVEVDAEKSINSEVSLVINVKVNDSPVLLQSFDENNDENTKIDDEKSENTELLDNDVAVNKTPLILQTFEQNNDDIDKIDDAIAKMDTEGNAIAKMDTEGNETAKMDTEGNAIAKMDTEGNETAKMDTEGNETAKMDTEGNETAKMDTESNETAKMDTEGNETAKMDTEGNETAKMDTEGNVTAKMDTEGNAIAKMDTEGNETAKMDTEGNVTAKMDTEGNAIAKMDTEGNETAKMDTEGNVTAKMDTEGNAIAKMDTKENATAKMDDQKSLNSKVLLDNDVKMNKSPVKLQSFDINNDENVKMDTEISINPENLLDSNVEINDIPIVMQSFVNNIPTNSPHRNLTTGTARDSNFSDVTDEKIIDDYKNTNMATAVSTESENASKIVCDKVENESSRHGSDSMKDILISTERINMNNEKFNLCNNTMSSQDESNITLAHNNVEQTNLSNDKISFYRNNDSPVNFESTNDCAGPLNKEGRDNNDVNTISKYDCYNNDYKQANTVLNTSVETLNVNNTPIRANETKSEEDDRRLMEELDAQIGANCGRKDTSTDKITLEDIIGVKNDENSLGLDSISDDDFDFDN